MKHLRLLSRQSFFMGLYHQKDRKTPFDVPFLRAVREVFDII